MVIQINNDLKQIYDISKGYTIINGFAYSAVTYPFNVHDGIIIKCSGRSDCESPQYNIADHSIDMYINQINKLKIEKTTIILDNINFLNDCKTLKHLRIIPSFQSGKDFNFSPLYDMPEIKSLSCQTQYGDREQFSGLVDYSKINGLVKLNVSITKDTINYNQIEMLKSLRVSNFKSANRDLNDLFCSKQLDTLTIVQSGMKSLNGIEISNKMQCLYLHYNRSLCDISALSKVKSTLKALYIENSSQIKDFSVLGELENLERLELVGSNELTNLNFLKTMKHLKTFTFSINILDGDLSLCDNLEHVHLLQNKRNYNRKNEQLPKKDFSQLIRGNESVEEWRKSD